MRDRFHCLQLLVSVLILRSSNAVERVRMINHWIQTAVELRQSTIGNLYSFSAVMHSLLSAPVGFYNNIDNTVLNRSLANILISK